MKQKSIVEKTIILIPHYQGSFSLFLDFALYIKEKRVGIPHFVLYFGADLKARQILVENQIEFSIYKPKWFMKIPLIGRITKIIFDLIYAARLIDCLSPVQAMICAIETHQIEHAFISVMNRRQINTIVLQWAQTVPKEYYENIRSKGKKSGILSRAKKYFKNYIARLFRVKYAEFYGDGDAKYFAVMGPHYRDMFSQQGVSKDKLVITGHPEHDRLYELSQRIIAPEVKYNIMKSFNLDRNRPVWIFAREATVYFKLVPTQKDKEDIRTVLKTLSKYHPQVQIVLKLHPRDSEDYYNFVKKEFPYVILIHECDLCSLIAVCDLYVSQISSTMLWAVALEKPVISYDFNKQPFWDYFRNKEGIIKVDSPDMLAEKIQIIREKGLSLPERQKCLAAREKYMTFDGKAHQRICELIVK